MCLGAGDRVSEKREGGQNRRQKSHGPGMEWGVPWRAGQVFWGAFFLFLLAQG